MIFAYKMLLLILTPILWGYLHIRAFQGKEVKSRLNEKRGFSVIPRPQGKLIWFHAASVGEAQAALILINKIHAQNPKIFFLITSITVTSSIIIEKELNEHIIHQFVPIDHPIWVQRFLNYWKPDVAIFLESEIWPNILHNLKSRHISALLINGRLSDSSYKNWIKIKSTARRIFNSFDLILTQSDKDTHHFKSFGATAKTVGNIKLNAAPLPYDQNDFDILKTNIDARPLWLYASTHDGEEEIAAQTHIALKEKFPNLLTIIVPRHPNRSDDIEHTLKIMGVKVTSRGSNHALPQINTDIYLADTLGELGLFYRLCDIAMIGRSFSRDGGGGHNPIEAAQLGTVVLTGPNIQFQRNLFDPLFDQDAAIRIDSEQKLIEILDTLLSDEKMRNMYQMNTQNFIKNLNNIIDEIMAEITPFISCEAHK